MEVFGDSNEQFGTHEKMSPTTATSTIHVNCMKHDPIDLIYNFMLSKALLIHIDIVSIWCMTSFSIHIASNKCLYAYCFRHLFAGDLSLYRRNSDSAYSTASRATCSPIRYAHPTASHVHSIMQI